jgi:hypothetical protein
MNQWIFTRRSVGIAAACLLFAGAVLVAPFDELSAYGRNGIYLFRYLGALVGEWTVRILFASFFVAVGLSALRGRPARRR